MKEQPYLALQVRGDFDTETWSLLYTSPEIRATGYVRIGARRKALGLYGVYNVHPGSPSDKKGFRCMASIRKAKAA